ncbi:carbohydrate-binding protein [Cellulomonas taurus]|uniref:carbohydrate-binding protein n=1 Tax=Cellulomonas taurus TaxID=2729175 RepID=UPI00145D7F3D|nr:carbohydrate-binding protein [Cellulomonas taurus]
MRGSIKRLVSLAAAFGIASGGLLLVQAPAMAATCGPAWSASTAYTGGATVSKNGTNYTANWWTQGDDPVTQSGGAGSGKPWTSAGACTGGGDTGGGTDPGTGTNPGTGTASGLLFSPYKDVTVNLNWNTNQMRTAASGTVQPVVGANSLVSTLLPDLKAITLAFATGTCGSESWGGIAKDAFISANITQLNSAGLDYVVSTGGAAGSFKCASGDAMKAFIASYATPHLVGIDFDIESGQSVADIQALVNSAAAAQSTYPKIRFSFTLATLAASDGSYGGLNSTGDAVVKAIKASSLSNYTINLMTMDFGRATAANCVLKGATCDMGASTIQAAVNLNHTYGIPYTKVELTPMIGVNDVADEVFTLADVNTVTSWAVTNKIAGLHHWSLDRDTPCASPQSTASPICSSVTGSTPLQWTKRFLTALGQ